jgi:hypothetical protein
MVALCLRVVHGEPSFWQHANKHVPNMFCPCVLDVSVTPLCAVITVSEGPAVALRICRLDGDDRCRFSGSFHQGVQKLSATPAGLVSTSYGISAGVSKSFLDEGGG